MRTFVIVWPCMVAMAAMSAPLTEQTKNQEEVINLSGDSNGVDRAKRAKEEIVFGNQQNRARPAAAKKSVDFASFLTQPKFQRPDVFAKQENEDRVGSMYAAAQQLPVPVREETEAEVGGMGIPKIMGEKPREPSEFRVLPVPQAVMERMQGQAERGMGKGEESQRPEVEEPVEEIEQFPQFQSNLEAQAPLPAVEPEVQIPLTSNLPQDSRSADAEESLQAQDEVPKAESDDVETFLKDIQEPEKTSQSLEEGDEEVEKVKEKEEEEEEKENEKEEAKEAAEAELMQVINQNAADKSADSNDYTRKLLKYILLRGDEYGRVPVGYGYPSYPGSYYLQRHRRSLAHRRLPHIHRRRSSGHQLARSKRTKRDLFDDDLYYNPQEQFQIQQAEEEAEKEAEIKELMPYLMALYPALYQNQPQPQDTPYPGYLWYGSNYPEQPKPEYLEWEEPEYVEVPVGWEQEPEVPQPAVPAWEPAFYPEEVEDPNFYTAPAKRQMMAMFPEQRRKRYFNPYAPESYSRFVPSQEKRGYDNAYRRLRDLAMVLADAQQPSPYADAFADYRKK